jgi:hypothetical protein
MERPLIVATILAGARNAPDFEESGLAARPVLPDHASRTARSQTARKTTTRGNRR